MVLRERREEREEREGEVGGGGGAQEARTREDDRWETARQIRGHDESDTQESAC